MITPLIFLTLAGCAGRTAQPISVASSGDEGLSCTAIRAEIDANNTRMQALADEKGLTLTKNVAAGVVGIVFFPAWFFLDLHDAAATEMQSLNSRQTYLGEMASSKCRNKK